MTKRWSIPVFVDASVFASAHYDRELTSLARQRSKANFATAIGMTTVTMSLALIIGRMDSLRWEPILAATAVCFLLLIAISALRDFTVSTISSQQFDYRWRLKNANALLANSIYYGDDQKMWWKVGQKGKDPREEVYNWCVSNEIPAILATYDDPMFGQFGMLVSMPDDESMIFFKLKYMDRI